MTQRHELDAFLAGLDADQGPLAECITQRSRFLLCSCAWSSPATAIIRRMYAFPEINAVIDYLRRTLLPYLFSHCRGRADSTGPGIRLREIFGRPGRRARSGHDHDRFTMRVVSANLARAGALTDPGEADSYLQWVLSKWNAAFSGGRQPGCTLQVFASPLAAGRAMRASLARIKGFRRDYLAWDRLIDCDRHSDWDRLCRAVPADPEARRIFLSVVRAYNDACGGAFFV